MLYVMWLFLDKLNKNEWSNHSVKTNKAMNQFCDLH